MCDEELFVVDSCVVIDFCGRTDNLDLLMTYLGDRGVVTSAVVEELKYRCGKTFPLLSGFLELVESGRVATVDPDLADQTASRIVSTWSKVFGAGEVSSAAVAASRRWVLLSVDREPMQQFGLREVIMLKSTKDALASLVRRRRISKQQSDRIQASIRAASSRKRRH